MCNNILIRLFVTSLAVSINSFSQYVSSQTYDRTSGQRLLVKWQDRMLVQVSRRSFRPARRARKSYIGSSSLAVWAFPRAPSSSD
jgi:hypothetical protein